MIGDIVSNTGSAGNTVYIMGEGLDGNVTVKFNNTVATVVSASGNMIETQIPSGAAAGENLVTVTKNGVVSNSIIYKVYLETKIRLFFM